MLSLHTEVIKCEKGPNYPISREQKSENTRAFLGDIKKNSPTYSIEGWRAISILLLRILWTSVWLIILKKIVIC
jgi:hypothetical protein